MKMMRIVFGAAFAAASVLGLSAGCGSTAQSGQGTSAMGQSCTRTFDCANQLLCVANVCVPATSADAGSDGTTMVTGPQFGQKGDSCQSSLDCGSGLVCIASSSGGVCDTANYNLAPTGNLCGECRTSADCCELPTNLNLATSVITDAGTFALVYAHTCEDLLGTFLGGSTSGCSTAQPGFTMSKACFYYNTYCAPGCGPTTWSCTNNRCVFAGACTSAGYADDQNGCPSRTRTTATPSTTCNAATHTCGGATPSNCTMAPDCDGQHAVDNSLVTCQGGDCACYQGSCYLACSKDIDCPFGYACDATKRVCVQQPACNTDADCAITSRNVLAKCVNKTCKAPCQTDHDCSPSGDINGTGIFNGYVCQNGFCANVGCSSDIDCSSGGLHAFCVAPPSYDGGAPGTVAVSAVTN